MPHSWSILSWNIGLCIQIFIFIVHIYSHLSQINFNLEYNYLEGYQHITHLDKVITSPPPRTTCSFPSHPPSSPSLPNIQSQRFWQEDLDSGCLVTNHQHSLAGRPYEGWTNNCWCFFVSVTSSLFLIDSHTQWIV